MKLMIRLLIIKSPRLIALAFAAISLSSALAVPGNTAGPLVGHVEAQSARLWMHIPDGTEGTCLLYTSDAADE